MLFPELEHGLLSTEYYERLRPLESSITDIDLLEIAQGQSAAVNWQQGLNHEKLLTWFERSSTASKRTEDSALRILFLNSNVVLDFYTLKLHPSTLGWLQTQFSLPMFFFDCVVNVSKWAKTGNGCFVRHDDEGRIIRIETFYRIGGKGGAIHIWFAHHLSSKSTVYVISNCPQEAKDRIVGYTSKPEARDYNRPLLVDAFLVNFCSGQFKEEIEETRQYLISYEYYRTSQIPSEGLAESFENLHRLSQTWHILYEDLVDLEERSHFLLEVCSKFDFTYGCAPSIKTAETLNFLASRTQFWRRWVANYNTRTKNRINLFFNLAVQNDSRINIEVARLTKDIAQESRKDSSSMITIAALTMVFLPGTFVAAVFSMVYFTVDKDQDGSIRLVVMPQLWQFVVITIGLTVLVFMVWIVWQRMQIERLSRSRKEMDGGTNPWKAPSGTISNGGAVELQEQATHPFPQLARGPYRSRHFDLRGVNVDPALTYQF